MDANDELWTVDELAAYLKVLPSTVYKWRTRNTGPPAVRAGKFLRWRRSDVEAWLQANEDPREAVS